jgi:hypothetical protein
LDVAPWLCPDLLNIGLHEHVHIISLVVELLNIQTLWDSRAIGEGILHRVLHESVGIYLCQDLLIYILQVVVFIILEHLYRHVNLKRLKVGLIQNKTSLLSLSTLFVEQGLGQDVQAHI